METNKREHRTSVGGVVLGVFSWYFGQAQKPSAAEVEGVEGLWGTKICPTVVTD